MMMQDRSQRINVNHDGWFNPWDMTEEERVLADKCRESGGLVFRTGWKCLVTGMNYGDGLHFVTVKDKETSSQEQ